MPDGNRGPEKVSDILGRLFTSRGWGRKNDRLRIEQAWTDVVGPELARETRVGGIRRAVLEVDVKNAVLIQELAQFHKKKLLEKLRKVLPGIRLTDLKFRAASW